MRSLILAVCLIAACGPKKSAPEAPPMTRGDAPLVLAPSAAALFAAEARELVSGEAPANYVMRVDHVVGGMGMTLRTTVTWQRPDRVQTLTEVPGMGTIDQGFDGTHGWVTSGLEGPRLLAGEELAAYRQTALLFRGTLPAEWTNAVLVGQVEIEGSVAWRVDGQDPAGEAGSVWFDAFTGRRVKEQAVADTVTGRMPVVTSYGAWKRVGPWLFPTTVHQKAGPLGMQVHMVDVLTDVPELPRIVPPDEVQALIEAVEVR